MTQTRVFVTYLPERALAARIPVQPSGSVAAPAITVLATALLASAAVNAVGGADASKSLAARIPETISGGEKAQRRQSLPYLALVRTPPPQVRIKLPTPEPDPPAAEPVRRQLAEPAKPKRASIASPRRDLAGFIESQGFAFAASPAALDAPQPPVDPSAPDAAPRILTLPGEEPALAVAQQPTVTAAASGTPERLSVDEPQSFPTVRIDGAELGAVTMRGDTVHLGSLVGLLKLKMPSEEFERLKAAPAAESFVSLSTLREAGIDVTVEDGGSELSLAVR